MMEVRQRKLESQVMEQSAAIEQLQVEMGIHREFLRLQFESFMDFLQQRGGDIIRIDSVNGTDPQTGLFIPFNNDERRIADDEGHHNREEEDDEISDDDQNVHEDDSSMMYPPPQAILGNSSSDDHHHQQQQQQSLSYNNNGHPSTSSPVNLSNYHIDRRMTIKQEDSDDGCRDASDSEDETAGDTMHHGYVNGQHASDEDETDDPSYNNLQYLNQQSFHRFPFAHFLDAEENQQHHSNGDHLPSEGHENGHRQAPLLNEYTSGPRRRTSSATPVENQHICRYCGKVFHWKQSWVIHERTHTGEKPYSCACGKAFSQKANMNTHAKQCKQAKAVHNGKTNIFEMKCSLCPKMFTSKKALDSHKMKSHPGSLTSSIMMNSSSNNLRNNNNSAAAGASSQDLAAAHMNTATSITNTQQNNQTMTRASLLRKTNTHEITSPELLLASLSSKLLGAGGGLGSSNSNNNNGLSLTTSSSRASSTASGGSGSSLNLISSVSPDGGHHPPGKSKHCRWCNKFFSRKTSLKIHERVHTGERPYACGFCGKTFTQKGSVKLHCQRVHNSVSYTNAYANNN